MIIAKNIHELQQALKSTSGSVGFVPTMGALHLGHRTLIEQARGENDIVVVSIFVNPTQFLAGEDLDKYPRRAEADFKICELCGADIVFYPDTNEMYGDDEVSLKSPSIAGFVLEGAIRPGHFDGVLTVVMKLFNLVGADRAYFGKKDAQQLILIKQMVQNLFIPIEIIAVDTVRESDGLALSSRNIYLSELERSEALKISASLKKATEMIMRGELNCEIITESMREILEPLDIEYIAITDRSLSATANIVLKNSIILVAARVGETRLIDNVWI